VQHITKACQYVAYFLGFEVLTAVVIKSPVLWDTSLCSPLKFIRRFGITCRVHPQGRRIFSSKTPA
jgi:hypothetical protein